MTEMKLAEEHMAYVAKAHCGCLKMAVVDDPKHAADTAKEVAKAIKRGYSVSRVTCEEVRNMDWYCKEHKAKQGSLFRRNE